ncbi:MAG: alpha/beta hydrolase [Bacteroidota bacterium]
MKNILSKTLTLILLALNCSALATPYEKATPSSTMDGAVHYRKMKVNGLQIFYREAGPAGAPVILLMHGYPTSSFMFRNLIPELSTRFHVIAPDLPGFGFSDFPSRKSYTYTFDNLANTMQDFTDQLDLKHFAIYIFDYGAPIGMRLILQHPERITGIISQNGNAYKEGLLDWSHGLVKTYWEQPTQRNRNAIRKFFTLSGTNFQYREGIEDQSLVAPETIYLDQTLMNRPENIEMQLDLLLDYRNNLKIYPVFQAYLRKYQPKLLAVWGSKDPYFGSAGALSFKRDDPGAKVKFYDTGHFALETHYKEIGKDVFDFLSNL